MENARIADIFDEIADLLDLQEGDQFRIRSYRNAARTVRNLSQRLEDMARAGKDLSGLPNIGDSTAEKIREIVETGTCQRLEEQRKKVPSEVTALMDVPEVGPRTAMQLHEELGIGNLDELREACENEEVRELEGMGAKTEEQILQGIATVKETSERILYREAAQQVESLRRSFEDLGTVSKWVVTGSYRRAKETVGDLDILVQAKDRKKTIENITQWDIVDRVKSTGKERCTVVLQSGLQVDFRFVEPGSFGAAMLYFTGSKAHNVHLRKIVRERGWKLNEYSLSKGERVLAGKTEESVYHRLNLEWVPPELREDRGEIEAAAIEAAAKDEGENAHPDLVEGKHIHGDLHTHTNATDGAHSIMEMAEAAKDRGHQYLAITDHSKAVSVAGGLDEDALRKHADEIREADSEFNGIWLLAGVEVDILKSGKLDLDEDLLADLDWVVASVHYNRNISGSKMTERIVSAVESGVVNCLGHPCGRMIGKRDPLEYDYDKVFETCNENGVVLEIDAQPDRLDLPDTFCQHAREMGLTFSIGTDAHSQSGLDFMSLGVNVARRGWLERKHIVNAKTAKQLRKSLGGK